MDATATYGFQIHLGGINGSACAYDYFAVQEYGDRAIGRLNFPEDRHRVVEYEPQGI